MPNLSNTMMIDSEDNTMTELFMASSTITTPLKSLDPVDQDMEFNDGHRLKIIVYR